jgi:glutathione S-transferase
MAVNVRNDFAWLEQELAESKGGFLVGDRVTVADVMMLFSVQFILKRELGVKEGEIGEKTREWVKQCEGSEGYRRAVERSGYRL